MICQPCVQQRERAAHQLHFKVLHAQHTSGSFPHDCKGLWQQGIQALCRRPVPACILLTGLCCRKLPLEVNSLRLQLIIREARQCWLQRKDLLSHMTIPVPEQQICAEVAARRQGILRWHEAGRATSCAAPYPLVC